MKKYSIIAFFTLFAYVFVPNVFAGGGFEDVTYNPDGTIKVTQVDNVNTNTAVGNYNDVATINQGATASRALEVLKSPVGIILIIILFLIALGLVYVRIKIVNQRDIKIKFVLKI